MNTLNLITSSHYKLIKNLIQVKIELNELFFAIIIEEKALNKECVDKMKDSVEFYKEKCNQAGRSVDELTGRVKELEEAFNKEKTERAEIDKANKRLEAVVGCYEGKKLEIELNLEKLMEQLK